MVVSATWAMSLPDAVPLHDLFANRRGAGEAQLADVGVVGETLSHHATWSRDRD